MEPDKEISTCTGPFHRLNDSPGTVRKILDSGEIWGMPPRGIFQSDIPKVKAYDGELPPEGTGIEFETEVKPDTGHVPGKPTWSESRGVPASFTTEIA